MSKLSLTTSIQLLFFALCSGVSALATTSTNRPLILVHSETIARTDKLTLGDIADIRNTDQPTTTLLQNISLGYSPEVGMVRQISRDKIAIAIAAAGYPAGLVEIKSQLFANVRRESQTVNPVLVREAVEKATLPGLTARGATAQIVKLDLPNRIDVRTGAIEVRASAGNLKNMGGPFNVSVEILVDNRVARRFNLMVQIEASASVVVAASDLAENTRLRAPDFKIETVRLDKDLTTYVFDPAQLRGVTLRRAITKGEAITVERFAPDIVVKPGDVVRIVGDSSRLSISLTGEARAAGHVGDRIQVKNLQSGTMLQAVIVDEGIVSVRF